MDKTLIVASTIERARDYARRYGYQTSDVVGGDINQLRGRHVSRIIIVGELDERTHQAIVPMMLRDTEVLRGE